MHKMKFQYTYFIYPFIVNENMYQKYIKKLILDNNYKIKFWEKDKDLEIYEYFLPNIREKLFKTFEYTSNEKKEFSELKSANRKKELSKMQSIIFEYNLKNDIQGKTEKEDGIFFKIQKIEIICFKPGICFLSIKTNIEETENFADLLNFNYKFRDINSENIKFKDLESIKIQTDSFSDIKEFRELIEQISGKNLGAKELGIDTNRFITCSYVCIDQENWNDNIEFRTIENEFFKYINLYKSTYNSNFDKENAKMISNLKYAKIGINKNRNDAIQLNG